MLNFAGPFYFHAFLEAYEHKGRDGNSSNIAIREQLCYTVHTIQIIHEFECCVVCSIGAEVYSGYQHTKNCSF